MKTTTKLGIGVGILAVLSPLGLILPKIFKSGSAWGEWGTDEIKDLIGYIPDGLEKMSSLWRAILPGYSFSGGEGQRPGNVSFAYIVSAIVGIALCAGISLLLGKLLTRKKNDGTHAKS